MDETMKEKYGHLIKKSMPDIDLNICTNFQIKRKWVVDESVAEEDKGRFMKEIKTLTWQIDYAMDLD